MKYTCSNCGHEDEINPASLLAATGKGKPKTMTPAAIAARSANGKKGGWPKGKPRKTPASIVKEP
jgi:hypothetical protein